MKIAFFGATKYSYELLQFLLENNFDVCAIFTLPEELRLSYPKGDMHIYNYANLKEIGDKYGIPTIEIKKKNLNYYEEIKHCAPDLILVSGWYLMLSKKIIEIPSRGCIGIHFSLLPKYAGGAPLVWAIINGEKETGITLFYFNEQIDAGDIIAQERFTIDYTDDISSVYHKATQSSKHILLENIPKLEKGITIRTKQDLSQRTVYPIRKPEEGKIDWSKSAEQIRNFVRAQTKPYPGAYSYIHGEKITIWHSEVVKTGLSANSAGKILDIEEGAYVVSTGEDCLRLIEFEPEKLQKVINKNDFFQ